MTDLAALLRRIYEWEQARQREDPWCHMCDAATLIGGKHVPGCPWPEIEEACR